jgi:hypothetical protein
MILGGTVTFTVVLAERDVLLSSDAVKVYV